ncbi:MAG TPA: GntR family transcriptional regulator [Dermatophilaceae bacterium]|nr:GntR family transcriptional regulator [Dermatophilaceae bacterium]
MLDRQSPTPLHQQLEEVINEKIANDEWKTNSQIPSENELSATYGLSRMTTRGVITRLAIQGLLYRVPGKGTFVAAPKIENMAQLPMGIQRQLDARGIPTKVRLLSLAKVKASGHARRKLNLDFDVPLWKVERLRTINDEPLSIHLSYLPVALCADLDEKDLADGQLRRVLEDDYGLFPATVEESVETALASERDASLLDVSAGFTLLQLEETSRTDADVPYEFCHVRFRGDKMKITFEFSAARERGLVLTPGHSERG